MGGGPIAIHRRVAANVAYEQNAVAFCARARHATPGPSLLAPGAHNIHDPRHGHEVDLPPLVRHKLARAAVSDGVKHAYHNAGGLWMIMAGRQLGTEQVARIYAARRVNGHPAYGIPHALRSFTPP